MNNNVEEVKSRINIIDLIGEYVRLNKTGTSWKGLCPFHHEKSPSFIVNEEKQFWHCFGCAKGGDAFAFIMEIESLGFREALALLAEKTGVVLESYAKKDTEKKSRTLEILEAATQFYETQLWQGQGKTKILEYLKARALTEESIRQFRLGYSLQSWDSILKFLIQKGYGLDEIARTGLLVEKNTGQTSVAHTEHSVQASRYYDRFRDRIMFPITDALGRVIGYSARVAPGSDESQAKYINTPESEAYHKGTALYGIHLAKNAIKQQNATLLVEGNMDVIAAYQAGISNTVAVSGTALTEQQLDILKRYGERIDMLFDMDSAGQQAAARSADLCFQKGITVKIVKLEGFKDAAEAIQQDANILLQAVASAQDAMEYFLSTSIKKHSNGGVDSKKAIAAEILGHIKHFSNEIEKSHWIKRLASELDVEEKAVIGVLNTVQKRKDTVYPRNIENVEESIEESFEKRSLLIRDKIAGIMLSEPSAWKDLTDKFSEDGTLSKDSLLAYLFAKGQTCQFSFDALMLMTNHEPSRKTLQRLYFDSKFTFDNSRNIVELDAKEKYSLALQYLGEFKRELQKERLAGIIKEIKKAEQAGDKERVRSLMSQFTQLSQELK